MTPSQLRQAMKRLGDHTSEDFAKRLHVHPVTVRKWLAGMKACRGSAEQLIKLLLATTRRPRGKR